MPINKWLNMLRYDFLLFPMMIVNLSSSRCMLPSHRRRAVMSFNNNTVAAHDSESATSLYANATLFGLLSCPGLLKPCCVPSNFIARVWYPRSWKTCVYASTSCAGTNGSSPPVHIMTRQSLSSSSLLLTFFLLILPHSMG